MRRLFFLLAALPMLLVFPYVRRLDNPNELVRVYTTMALVERGSYRIEREVETFGWVLDLARVNGHYVMVKAPGIVYAGVPGYVLFSKVVAPALGHHYPEGDDENEVLWWIRGATWSMRLLGCQLPCFLFLLWFERHLARSVPDEVLRLATVAAVGFGTNYLAYAHMFASHSPYAICAFVAFALLERRDPRAALAGFLTSACVALEYPAIAPALVLCAYAATVHRGRKLLAFALGGLANVPHVMLFQWLAYGSPFTPGHKLIEHAPFAAEHARGLWGILWPSWTAVKALAIDPGFGFFGTSPFMVLGLLGLFVWRRSTLVWAACMALVLLVNAGFIEWRAGWTVGPRYLVVCAPFFGYGAALALDRLPAPRTLVQGAACGLALASVVTIGTVGLTVDTLPDTIGRPFAQFFLPMARAGFAPHHVGEWFGWRGPGLFYVACAAMLALPLIPLLGPGRRSRLAAAAVAFAVGMVPALTRPRDATALFELHPSTAFFADAWEPRRL